MERFSVDNRLGDVSFEQYRKIAEELEGSIRGINENITSKLLLTTNRGDYYEHGSLSVVTPESEAARGRREEFNLRDLDEDLWQRSFETKLYIRDNTIETPYMISLSVEEREPKSMKFCGRGLDEESQRVFDSFRKAGWFQSIGDGSSEPSPYAAFRASRISKDLRV